MNEACLTVWLAPQAHSFAATRAEEIGARPVLERAYRSRAELRAFGDADADVRAAVAERFRAHGLLRIEHAWRRVVVRGPRATCDEAADDVRNGALGKHVDTIFGLDAMAKVASYAHTSKEKLSQGLGPREIAEAYRLPRDLDGRGTSIGVLHFSGTFHPEDFAIAMHASRVKAPHCVQRGEAAASSQEDDVEIALDSQVAGSIAPGAKLVLYRGREDARSYADTIAEALLDELDAPAILSISYGDAEGEWSAGARIVVDRLFIAAALCGITVIAASGDSGSDVAGRAPQVMFPASSRFALACGGTNLRLENGRRRSEDVWAEAGGASGGGYSRVFERTAWHAPGDRGTGRGVPDVAAHAATQSGYRIVVCGTPAVAGGTSAAAPLWAGFIALVNQSLGMPCGFFTPLLYRQAPPSAFHDVTTGTNGRYRARAGWDPCTGLGSPNFDALLRFFKGAS